MAALYPVFLKLDGQPVLVVGGGTVAAGKLDGLIAAGARVTLVAPEISAEARKRSRHVRFIERELRDSDLDGARWVVAAATPDVNRAVSAAANARKLFVNAVDDPDAASAYLGGVVRRGDVTVAISTTGVAPALAGLLREALDALLPAELERWLEVAHDLRRDWKQRAVPIADRRPLLLRALDTLYRRGDEPVQPAVFDLARCQADDRPSGAETLTGTDVCDANDRRAGACVPAGHRRRTHRLPLRSVRRGGTT